MPSRIVHELQGDYNDLAVEARHSKNVGLTGQISGLFQSGQHNDVKAAAEAAQVALRGLESAEDPEKACRECTVRLAPMQLPDMLLSHASAQLTLHKRCARQIEQVSLADALQIAHKTVCLCWGRQRWALQ